jgi:predicted nucleic acid-binding protein
MRQYPLLPTNVYHLACALEAGVNAFASLDKDLLVAEVAITSGGRHCCLYLCP